MNDKTFFFWTGWGLVLLAGFTVSLIGSIALTKKFGASPPIRLVSGLITTTLLVGIFVTSGWLAGLISIPIGLLVGAQTARWIMPPRK
jgi:uncharacterized protein YqgC (DUF456 family)